MRVPVITDTSATSASTSTSSTAIKVTLNTSSTYTVRVAVLTNAIICRLPMIVCAAGVAITESYELCLALVDGSTQSTR